MSSAQIIPEDDVRYTVITAKGECIERDWKDAYDLACYSCGHEQSVRPSLFQKMGHSSIGYGKCTACVQPLQIVHDPETNTMKSQEPKGE